MKKPRVAFTICDKKSEWMLPMLTNSLRKFHSEEELPLIVYGEEQMAKIEDPHKFYRATPMFARKLIKEYELVLKLDVDQIITGSLEYIFYSDYEVGTVYNWNRIDPQFYGEVGLCTIQSQEYYNNGLVAMRSERFVENWWKLCNSAHFERMPMREQGFLNILCHYGDYRVRCFDDYDRLANYSAWHGLISKGEWGRAELKNDQMIIPSNPDGFPDRTRVVKVLHWATGNDGIKMDYRIRFSEECIKFLDYLVSDEGNKTNKE